MALPRMRQSWCGCSLQTGAKIIAILSWLTSVGILLLRGVQIYLMLNGTAINFDECYQTRLAMYWLMVSTGGIRVVPSVLLIIAAYRRCADKAVPWLLIDMKCRLIDLAILTLAVLLQPCSTNDTDDIIIYSILIVVSQYLWWVVYSFYRHLKEDALVAMETSRLLGNIIS